MTDFVNRLLGLAGAPAIRPVVASLFEPVVAAVVARPLPMGEVTESDPPALPAEGGPARVIDGRRPSRRDRWASVASRPVTTARPPAAGLVTGPEPAQEPATTAVDAQAPDFPATVVVGHPVDLPRQAAASVPSATAQPPVFVTGDPVPESVASVATEAPAAHAVGDVTRPRSHPVAARHDALQRPATRAVPAVGQQKPATEPTVHISIGRVEVRAVAAPATPKRPEQGRRNAPSLDDYLRNRAGGERG